MSNSDVKKLIDGDNMQLKSIAIIASMMMNLVGFSSFAAPDVFFSDSYRYDDAFLVLGLEGDEVNFSMSNDRLGIALPHSSYNFDALSAYVNNEYHFRSARLKRGFIQMFVQSFDSEFRGQNFVQELLKILSGFTENYPQHVR